MAYGYKFDRNKVIRSANRRSRKALEFIARDLQQQIRRKLKRQTKKQPHSRPGEPPRIETPQSPLKKLINYAITDNKVYVGPMIFKDAKGKQSSPVPSILEKGGRSIAHVTEFRNIVKRRIAYDRYGWYKSEAARRRALQSAAYKQWKRNNTYEVNRPVRIQPRPFVRATYNEYMRAGGIAKAIKRAKEWCDKRKI